MRSTNICEVCPPCQALSWVLVTHSEYGARGPSAPGGEWRSNGAIRYLPAWQLTGQVKGLGGVPAWLLGRALPGDSPPGAGRTVDQALHHVSPSKPLLSRGQELRIAAPLTPLHCRSERLLPPRDGQLLLASPASRGRALPAVWEAPGAGEGGGVSV